jgi:hypothetical protein
MPIHYYTIKGGYVAVRYQTRSLRPEVELPHSTKTKILFSKCIHALRYNRRN